MCASFAWWFLIPIVVVKYYIGYRLFSRRSSIVEGRLQLLVMVVPILSLVTTIGAQSFAFWILVNVLEYNISKRKAIIQHIEEHSSKNARFLGCRI